MTAVPTYDLSHEDLKSFFSMSLDLFCIAGFDGFFKFLNPEWERVLGYSVEELLSRPYLEFVHPDDRVPTDVVAETLAGGNNITSFENRYVRKDGEPRWITWRATSLTDRGAIYAVGRDITDRKIAEEEKRRNQNEQFFRLLVEKTTDVISILDEDGTIRYTSPSIESLLGYTLEELKGRSRFEFIHPDDQPEIRLRVAALQRKELPEVRMQYRVRHKDGSWRKLETVARNHLESPFISGYVWTTRDMTQQSELEEQLRQAQKMEVVGQLAGGIAHDFNNLLSVINGYTELMMDDLPPGAPNRAELEIVLNSGQKAAELTHQLLAFSRKQVLVLCPLNINRVIADSVKLLRRVIGEGVELVLDEESQLGTVLTDPGQIHQVIMNLSVNARDAMPDGGRLSISTRNVEIDNQYADQHPDVTPGSYVMLAVTDTGTGMSPDVRSHVFEPFFTTKAPGKGTGLGLSTVYGIVKQTRGHVVVRSEPGHGTTFEIYLPRVADSEVECPNEPLAVRAHRAHASILVVEDEEAVRQLAKRLLEQAGYRVIDSSGPADALLLCEDPELKFDLLITDVVMPRMSGPQLAKRVSAGRPELKVLYMSGFTEHPSLPEGDVALDGPLLHKPFVRDTLLARVRDALE